MDFTESEKAAQFKNEGNQHFKNKDYHKAIESYTKAISLNSIDPSYYANRAACYLALKKYNSCIDDCNETLNIDPKFSKAWRRKGRAYFYLGDLKESKLCFEEAIKLDPNDSSLKDELRETENLLDMVERVEGRFSRKEFSDANNLIMQALQLCPDAPTLKIKQIEALAKAGESKQAIKKAQEFQSTLGTNPDFLYVYGLALAYDGQTEAAKKIWRESLKFDPDNKVCLHAQKMIKHQEELKQKGNDAMKANDYKGAIKAYTEAIEQDPDNRNVVSVLYANRALAQIKLKNHKQALSDLNKSIELNEKYAKAYSRRGDVKMELEDPEGARQDYQHAHTLDPSLGIREKLRDADKEAKKAAKKDYYKILDIPKTANDDEIKKAYRKLALKWHPDKNQGSEEEKKTAEAKFKDINEAYSVLSDQKKRQMYDSGADMEGEFAGFNGQGFNPNDIFQAFFGGGDPFGGGGFSFFSGGDEDSAGMGGGMGGFPGGLGGLFANLGGMGGSRGGMPGNVKFTFKTSKASK